MARCEPALITQENVLPVLGAVFSSAGSTNADNCPTRPAASGHHHKNHTIRPPFPIKKTPLENSSNYVPSL